MKFSSTVDSLSRENRYLRGAIALLAIGVILSGLGVLPRRPLEKRPVVAGSKPASSKTSFGLNLNRFYWQSWPQPV